MCVQIWKETRVIKIHQKGTLFDLEGASLKSLPQSFVPCRLLSRDFGLSRDSHFLPCDCNLFRDKHLLLLLGLKRMRQPFLRKVGLLLVEKLLLVDAMSVRLLLIHLLEQTLLVLLVSRQLFYFGTIIW